MADPNQVRINELARELEIKAKVLIDYLPEAGVTEKKTHSSSIDLKHAELVRKHFRGLAAAEQAEAADKAAKATAAKKPAAKPAAAPAGPAAAGTKPAGAAAPAASATLQLGPVLRRMLPQQALQRFPALHVLPHLQCATATHPTTHPTGTTPAAARPASSAPASPAATAAGRPGVRRCSCGAARRTTAACSSTRKHACRSTSRLNGARSSTSCRRTLNFAALSRASWSARFCAWTVTSRCDARHAAGCWSAPTISSEQRAAGPSWWCARAASGWTAFAIPATSWQRWWTGWPRQQGTSRHAAPRRRSSQGGARQAALCAQAGSTRPAADREALRRGRAQAASSSSARGRRPGRTRDCSRTGRASKA